MDPILTDEENETLSIDGEAFDASDREDEGPDIFVAGSIDEQRLLDELYKDLKRGDRAREVLAEAETRKVAEFTQAHEHRTIDGLGQLVASVPLSVFCYWVAREGAEFFHERSNIDFLAKRAGGTGNPGIMARTVKKPMVMVDKSFPAAGIQPVGHEKQVEAGKGLPASTLTCRAESAEISRSKRSNSKGGVHGRRGRWAT
jgi:hypothetical protein